MPFPAHIHRIIFWSDEAIPGVRLTHSGHWRRGPEETHGRTILLKLLSLSRIDWGDRLPSHRIARLSQAWYLSKRTRKQLEG